MIPKRLWSFVAIFVVAALSDAPAQEREWSWDETDTDAFLVFGTPNTDDVGISFWCKLGSSQITFFVPGVHGRATKQQKAVADVTIGGKLTHLKGIISPNTGKGSHEFETVLRSNDVIFSSLAEASFFEVDIAGKKSSYPLDTANIEDLVKTCKNHPN